MSHRGNLGLLFLVSRTSHIFKQKYAQCSTLLFPSPISSSFLNKEHLIFRLNRALQIGEIGSKWLGSFHPYEEGFPLLRDSCGHLDPTFSTKSLAHICCRTLSVPRSPSAGLSASPLSMLNVSDCDVNFPPPELCGV